MAPEMAAKFDIDDRTGQIKVKTVLDFEAGGRHDDNVDANDDRTFAVVVTATDPSLATKTAEVRIARSTDLNEAPEYWCYRPKLQNGRFW